MDARITKQRLGNLISYDWLKMLVTILIFVLVLVLLFTMTATRPKNTQRFDVYAYTDLSPTTSFTDLGDALEREHAFSYDILSVTSENFSGQYASAVFTTRRSASQGNVMFMTNNRVYRTDENNEPVLGDDGNPVVETESQLYSFAMGNQRSPDNPYASVVYDSAYYLQLCEEYLVQFFGDDWAENDAFDGERTPEESFARNDGDKRFRTAEQKAAGLQQERERLWKLREDYLYVQDAFADGTLSHATYEGTKVDGSAYTASLAIDLSGLNRLQELVYYTDSEGNRTAQNVCLTIFYNNHLYGEDLCFETVSFVRYLVEKYDDRTGA